MDTATTCVKSDPNDCPVYGTGPHQMRHIGAHLMWPYAVHRTIKKLYIMSVITISRPQSRKWVTPLWSPGIDWMILVTRWYWYIWPHHTIHIVSHLYWSIECNRYTAKRYTAKRYTAKLTCMHHSTCMVTQAVSLKLFTQIKHNSRNSIMQWSTSMIPSVRYSRLSVWHGWILKF
jgi:hypothetical protein